MNDTQPMNPVIKSDILRYKKNKMAANLALIGLALGCLYFLILYSQVKNNDYYYTWWIAFDVIYNLFFMLFVFLFSEQVKGYDRSMFVFQLVVGVLQIARIFWLPLCGLLGVGGNPTFVALKESGAIEGGAISLGTFFGLAISLAASGVCIIASGVIGFIRSKEVENFNKKIEDGEIDVDATLKELDAEDERKAANVQAEANVNETEKHLVEEDANA